MQDLMEIILVEDSRAVRTDIQERFKSRYCDLIVVHLIEDWLAAQKKLGKMLTHAHVILSDINLAEGGSPNSQDDKYLRTRFDGFRVFGFAKKINPSIPIVLYTGDDLAKNALDQLDDPDGPVWVVLKTGSNELEACADRLAGVAEKMIWETPLERREQIYKRLLKGDKDALEERVMDGQPKWESVLAIIAAKKKELSVGTLVPEVLAGYLAPFLPTKAFKISLLCRMFKPGDFNWDNNNESFAIHAPKPRLKEAYAAWEQLIHPTIDFENTRWQSIWNNSISDAEQEFSGVRSKLLESTAGEMDECLKMANRISNGARSAPNILSERLEEYKRRFVNEKGLSDKLRKSWSDTLRKVFKEDYVVEENSLFTHPFCAEWEEGIERGLRHILNSSKKHSGNTTSIWISSAIFAADGKWRLRVVISDKGPGINEFAVALTDRSMVRPTEKPARNHKLQLAQGALWGYCKWTVLTRSASEANCRYRDVFGTEEDIDTGDAELIKLAEELCRQQSGTIHILDFPCPLLKH